MNSTQRAIKYGAMAFAIFLAISIITGIASVAFAVVNAIDGNTTRHMNFGFRHNDGKYAVDYNRDYSDVKSLNLDNAIGNLEIRVGETFRVEAKNVSKGFSAEVDENGCLNVGDNGNDMKFLWFNFRGITSPNSKITVYLPADFAAKEVNINTGAGTLSIDQLNTDYLYIEGGAGKISGNHVQAGKARLEGGVGTINLNQVLFEDSNIECGVGSVDINGKLLGQTYVECGVGEVKLNLEGRPEDYGYKVDTGLGTISLNGDKISGENNVSATNLLKIDGGIGSVKIRIQSEFVN
jgi:hypothetical protein